jgi:hypothetical protein
MFTELEPKEINVNLMLIPLRLLKQRILPQFLKRIQKKIFLISFVKFVPKPSPQGVTSKIMCYPFIKIFVPLNVNTQVVQKNTQTEAALMCIIEHM